jgi:hypothetical protein
MAATATRTFSRLHARRAGGRIRARRDDGGRIPGPVTGSPDDGCFERAVDTYDDGSVEEYEFAIDVDDGFDIDEAGPGSMFVTVTGSVMDGNLDEGSTSTRKTRATSPRPMSTPRPAGTPTTPTSIPKKAKAGSSASSPAPARRTMAASASSSRKRTRAMSASPCSTARPPATTTASLASRSCRRTRAPATCCRRLRHRRRNRGRGRDLQDGTPPATDDM